MPLPSRPERDLSRNMRSGLGCLPGCWRCRPDEEPSAAEHANIVAQACRKIAESHELPTLSAQAGVTPKALAIAHRSNRVRDESSGGTCRFTGANYGAGSKGRCYAKSNEMLGITPLALRSGGSNAEIRFASGECSLGSILVAATGKGVCGIPLGDDPDELAHELQDTFRNANLMGGNDAFERLVARVVDCRRSAGARVRTATGCARDGFPAKGLTSPARHSRR